METRGGYEVARCGGLRCADERRDGREAGACHRRGAVPQLRLPAGPSFVGIVGAANG